MAWAFQGREKQTLLSKDKKFGIGLKSAQGKNKAKAKAGIYTLTGGNKTNYKYIHCPSKECLEAGTCLSLSEHLIVDKAEVLP